MGADNTFGEENFNTKMRDLNELERLVLAWGESKGILSKSSPEKQFSKTLEEVWELELAMINQSLGNKTMTTKKGDTVNTENEIKDSIGDICVTLILLARLQGTSLTECLNQAYEVISKRTGKMINGVFVKSEDLNVIGDGNIIGNNNVILK